MTIDRDTIFALSSGRLPAAIAVIRVSGPRASDAVKALAGRIPKPRHAMLVRLRQQVGTTCIKENEAAGEFIDEALVLWFPGPGSETGEDTAEFQVHGGQAVVMALVTALGRLPGLRPAKPGEFTRRAFANGKLDLTRVEGLADLIGAETESQRRQAFLQFRGLLGDRAERWRGRLIEALALVEAMIDFPDEGGVPQDLLRPTLAIASEIHQEIGALLDDKHRGERLRDGLTVAIAGFVNVGKSRLMNRLAKREAAIVSPYAGTTRDVIEVHLDLGGYPVAILDTAGLRSSDDPVEREGIRRATERSGAADLVLWVVDASAPEPTNLPEWLEGADGRSIWSVFNKCDLLEEGKAALFAGNPLLMGGSYRVSAETGAGIDSLVAGITEHAARVFGTASPAIITRERHRADLAACREALGWALERGPRMEEDIVAEGLRLAARALGRLVGRVDVEDVLDAIFRDFCVGK
jgi:tRNA modification GTPase